MSRGRRGRGRASRAPVLEHARERQWVSGGAGRAYSIADPGNVEDEVVRVRDEIHWRLNG